MYNDPHGSSTKQSRSYVDDDTNDQIYRDQATEAMIAEGCPNDDLVVLRHLRQVHDASKKNR